MDYQKFCQSVLDYLKTYMVTAEISLNTVLKTNGIERVALNILPKGIRYAPNIYLEPVYERFGRDDDVDQAAAFVLQSYTYWMGVMEEMELPDFDLEDFEQVREHLTIRMVNREWNSRILRSSVSIPFLDLSGVFYLATDPKKMNSLCRVSDMMVDSWGVSPEEMLQQVQKNLMRQGGFQMKDLYEILSPAGEIGHSGPHRGKPSMYVVTDRSRTNGPAVFFFPDVLKQFAEELGDDYLLLPSSINELIVVKNTDSDVCELKRIVREVNETMVDPEEILGCSIYKYCRDQSAVTVAA